MTMVISAQVAIRMKKTHIRKPAGMGNHSSRRVCEACGGGHRELHRWRTKGLPPSQGFSCGSGLGPIAILDPLSLSLKANSTQRSTVVLPLSLLTEDVVDLVQP